MSENQNCQKMSTVKVIHLHLYFWIKIDFRKNRWFLSHFEDLVLFLFAKVPYLPWSMLKFSQKSNHIWPHQSRNLPIWLTLWYNTYLNFMLHYIQHADLFWIISIWMMLPWITASVILIKFFCHSSSRHTNKNICALKQIWTDFLVIMTMT